MGGLACGGGVARGASCSVVARGPAGSTALARQDSQQRAHRLARERFAQERMRVDEGRARHVQAHRLEQHLVAVGGAVEGAGAGAVVRGRFGLQQLLAPDQALRELLAHLRLVGVRQAAAHRPGRHEHARQVAEVQRTDQQARHDLVAHAEQQRAVEHVVRERDGGAHRDRVAREQAQLHAGLALRDAVAHCRHTAGHLRGGAEPVGLVADQRRKALVRLVRREHVVVGRDDREVRCPLRDDAQFVGTRQRGERVRHVGAAQPIGAAWSGDHRVDTRQVGRARDRAAFADALGDFDDGLFHGRPGL